MATPITARLKEQAPRSFRKAELIERMTAECDGMTITQAAACLGVSYATICSYRDESGFTGLVRQPRQSNKPTKSTFWATVLNWVANLLWRKRESTGTERPIATRAREPIAESPTPTKARQRRRVSAVTARIVAEAPKLAARGLTMRDAARELGIEYDVLKQAVRYHLPNLKWRKYVSAGKEHPNTTRARERATQGSTSNVSWVADRIIEEAPELAARGLTMRDAARELGIAYSVFKSAVYRHLPDVQWRKYVSLGKEHTHTVRARERAAQGSTQPKAQPKAQPEIRSATVARIVAAAPELAARGLTQRDAAHELGVDRYLFAASVRYHLPDLKWQKWVSVGKEHPHTIRARERAGKGLTPAQVRKAVILQRLKNECEGMTIKQAAEHLGVTYPTLQAYHRDGLFTGFALQRRRGAHKAEIIKRLKSECDGMTIEQAAKHLDVTYDTIKGYRRDGYFTGLVARVTRRGARKAELIKRLESECAGMTMAQAAKHLGVTYKTISAYRNNGEITGLVVERRLGDEKAKFIKRLENECAGMTIAQAAKHFGVTNATIRGYLRRGEIADTVLKSATGRHSSEQTQLDVAQAPVLPECQRLSDEAVQHIVDHAPALAESGWSQAEAARELGADERQFAKIVKRHHPDLEWYKAHEACKVADLVVAEAPELAARGLLKAEAACELGVPERVFHYAVERHLPDLEWHNGHRAPMGSVIARVIAEAPKLAARGLTRAEAARELGVPKGGDFYRIIGRHLPDLEWRSGPSAPRGSTTARVIAEAPKLAARGLCKAEAALEMEMNAKHFRTLVNRHLPDLEWRDGSVKDGKARHPHGSITTRVLAEAPKLAARGLTKSEAAREIGIDRSNFGMIVRQQLPDIEWRNGRGWRKAV